MSRVNNIPIFFATDENYAPCLAVAIKSLSENLTPCYNADIHILTEGLTKACRQKLLALETPNLSIKFDNVKSKVKKLSDKLHVRDYYSAATYYRFFIPSMFPEYEKCLYLDCDIAINCNIAKLYETPLGDNLLAAAPDDVIRKYSVFGDYSETVLHLPRDCYFNAGILVMNLAKMREEAIEEQFANLLSQRIFRVAQDQDYLNFLCYGRVKYLDMIWNKTPFSDEPCPGGVKIVHYKLNFKPWKYDDVVLGEIFWKYAEMTPFVSVLYRKQAQTTKETAYKDRLQFAELIKLAKFEIGNSLKLTRPNSGFDLAEPY